MVKNNVGKFFVEKNKHKTLFASILKTKTMKENLFKEGLFMHTESST
jgi:hypothetical protein